MGQVRRDILHEGVRAWLAAATNKECGLVDPPADVSDPAYTILYPVTRGRGEGSFFDPEEDCDWVYQVSTFGEKKETVFWLSSLVAEAFLGRDASGKYQHPFAIVGVNVQWRLSDGSGAIVPSGVSTYEAQDTYRIRTGA